jgi:hypothetical protein
MRVLRKNHKNEIPKKREYRVTDFNEIVPELKDWNNGKGIDIESWIGCIGDFQKAIGYSAMFWPEFKEVNGCVVNANASEKIINDWIKKSPENPKAVEPVMNHLHIADLHYEDRENVSVKALAYLGNVLKEIYQCKLQRDFPDKTFVVEFTKPEDENDIIGYEMTFYQKDEKE